MLQSLRIRIKYKNMLYSDNKKWGQSKCTRNATAIGRKVWSPSDAAAHQLGETGSIVYGQRGQ